MTPNVHETNRSLAGPPGPVCRSVDKFCHDVRNKLSVIMDYASMIADGLCGPVSPEQEEYLAVITKAANTVTDMVGELLEDHATAKE